MTLLGFGLLVDAAEVAPPTADAPIALEEEEQPVAVVVEPKCDETITSLLFGARGFGGALETVGLVG